MILKDLSALNWLGLLNQAFDVPAILPTLLKEKGVTESDLLRVARKSTNNFEPYGRQVLYRSPDIEVMLAAWSYQFASCPHNHGFSKGLIWFVKGDFQEQQFQFKSGSLQPTGDLTFFSEGEVASVVSNDIHSCKPSAEGISLHIYSPAIENMKVWDIEKKEILTVADECGAWVPANDNLVIKRAKWA